MSLVRRLLTHFGFARQLPTQREELRRTLPKHVRTIQKADRVIEDYRRQDVALKIVVEKK